MLFPMRKHLPLYRCLEFSLASLALLCRELNSTYPSIPRVHMYWHLYLSAALEHSLSLTFPSQVKPNLGSSNFKGLLEPPTLSPNI